MHTQPIILVTGVNGQVGFELIRSLQGLGRVISLDLWNFSRIRNVIREVKPSIIVNPAAYTAVDKAEFDVSNAMWINGEVPGILAEEAAKSEAVLIHYSTDYVFDGTKAEPYVEDDTTNPQNVYGHSKLVGEQAIVTAKCSYLILRTSWVYGRRGKNFLLTMLKLGTENRPELQIVADQFGAPTWCNTIAMTTAHIIMQGIVAQNKNWWSERSGVYHLAAAGATSWYGFAEAIFNLVTSKHVPNLVPISTNQCSASAKRPANSRMALCKLSKTFGLYLPTWDEALRLCLSN